MEIWKEILDELIKGYKNPNDLIGDAWDIALQLTALREKAGLTQKEVARRLNTSQQHISRLESPGYKGCGLDAKSLLLGGFSRLSAFRGK